jgi:hypothetical protein
MVPLVPEGKGKRPQSNLDCRAHGLMVPLVPEGKGKRPQSKLQGPWTHGPASPGR